MKNTQSARLDDCRARLTTGVQLGLGYAYYDSAYLAMWACLLPEYHYAPRDDLQHSVRTYLSNRRPIQQIGIGWPGGSGAFRREFKIFQGISVDAQVLDRKREFGQTGGSAKSA